MSVVFAAPSTDASAGWGKLIALLAAAAAFWALTKAHQRWLATRQESSPTAAAQVSSGAKPQVKAVGGTSGTSSERGAAELDVFVAQKVGRARTTDIVRAAQHRYRVSRRTALRAISRAKNGGQS
jgi:hypothetical protein